MREVFIVGSARTPIGSFGGVLSTLAAPRLGAVAIRSALERSGIRPEQVDEVLMGNVLSANVGQAPARQAAIYAGLPHSVICTTVNKVCASGMKAVMFGAQSILLGDNSVVVAGGMESMSNVPYYLDKARTGYRLGHGEVADGIIRDALWDVYKDFHMGNAAEICAKECGISRDDQDEYALESYRRAAEAWSKGYFKNEIVPVETAGRKGEPVVVSEDEEYKKVNLDKLRQLRPVFQKEGTVTAANASSINDGAAAVVLASGEAVKELKLRPLARILAYADAEQAPEWFTTSPSKAIPKALAKAGISIDKVDYFEINEAFSVVAVANNRALKLDPSRVNAWGGAVSLGHPVGCSGARILVTLAGILQAKNARIGVAGICNGGGGASAMVIEKVV